jgi:hypothetical protein
MIININNMQETINERIRLITDKFYNGNVAEMAKDIDVKYPTLRDVVGTKQTAPGFKVLNKIVEKSSANINAEWLIIGKGNITNNVINQQNISGDNNVSSVKNTGTMIGGSKNRVEFFSEELKNAQAEIEKLKSIIETNEKILGEKEKRLGEMERTIQILLKNNN